MTGFLLASLLSTCASASFNAKTTLRCCPWDAKFLTLRWFIITLKSSLCGPTREKPDFISAPFELNIFSIKYFCATSKDEKIWGQYDVTVNGSSYTLIPHKKAEVTQIVLTLNGDHVQELKVTMKDGNTNSYALSNLAYSVSDSEFNYEVPADAQIDDERN